MSEKSDITDTKYQIYLAERSLLIEAEKSTAQQFDKAMLTLSAGALGISLTLIKDAVSEPVCWSKYLLFGAWLGFCGSITTTLFSFLRSLKACEDQRKILDEWIKSATETPETTTLASGVETLNRTSIALFVMGVITLIVFSIMNFF